MSKVYDKCPNCESKIRNIEGMFKSKNEIISKENYVKIKEFVDKGPKPKAGMVEQ